MINKAERKRLKLKCEDFYVEMGYSIMQCSQRLNVSTKSIYRWRKEGNWDDLRKEKEAMRHEIDLGAGKTLISALNRYAEDPSNKDLQSLVSLLREYNKKSDPPKEYADYIMHFIDKSVDFFLEQGDREFTQLYQSQLRSLAEYLFARSDVKIRS